MSIRVLLVDPEETLLDSYRDFLTLNGFQVETASTGPDCLTKLRQWQPDVLVLEPEMPDNWGDKILEDVTRQSQAQCVPVLILSRRDNKTVAFPIWEYHVKPYSMVALAHSIRAARESSNGSSPQV